VSYHAILVLKASRGIVPGENAKRRVCADGSSSNTPRVPNTARKARKHRRDGVNGTLQTSIRRGIGKAIPTMKIVIVNCKRSVTGNVWQNPPP